MIRVQDGDHNGRFALPSGEEVNGTLTLGADRPPSVSLHPDDPAGLTGVSSFPQNSRAPELVGYLFSNDEVIIGDVFLSEWFLRQVEASGRWALVGLDITQVPDRRWNTLQIRMTGLQALLGNAISSTLWPKDTSVDPPRFSADLNTTANYTSTTDAVTITVKYHWSLSPTDPYRFSLTNYATATLTTDQPLTVDEWAEEWVNPLLGLLTLATGERERITSALFSAPDPSRTADDARFPEITGQLFGAGIHQQDMPAERRTRPDGTPLVPLFALADAPPLADLIRNWRTSLGERTATALYRLSMDPTLPPPVRYLLCAQALESLHAEDHTAQEAAEDEAYDRERTAAIAAVTAVPDNVLDPSIKRFLRKNVGRRPLRSLANRLHHILATIPDRDILVATWTERTEPLVPDLTALDYRTEPLADRLGSIRNVLSHGSATFPERLVYAATRILETLLRGQLLTSLGFSNEQLVNAYRGHD
jgi:ApeA N-terminal domain 1/Apea-like HEPN